ncbi:enoyl-CoA hydratase/isomerase family protein [Limibaculum sp. M0105]|uniref:Enoyl-CoA hydratase/isomerase family protein n=1 Tax=Thermohalobaculum xanthum TaxID=2753746 RepID=A0A8J7M9Z0_9RHOB|nr:enoyl-CoA hydratase/isomerase family protein [Thermohalobaculum xanthum]MBK0400312.1 enoyl-CoA hydratase/isomerase family protein [Thermohalobaculum xanthum]
MTNELIYAVEGGIATVTFNRPESRNALTFAMYEGLAAICAAAPTDGSVKAIIVTGAGDRAFAAGTDMTQFRGFSADQDALDYEHKMDGVLKAIESCPVPTIAAITGACTGGGAAIAACCDLRISDARLKFGFPIARTLGNCLSVGNLARLASLLGPARTREILLTARLIEADEANMIGLVSEVLPDAEAVRARAHELARLLSGHAPLTMRATKEGLRRVFYHGPKADDADLILMTYMSEDFREGMEAFLGKRAPNWKGR